MSATVSTQQNHRVPLATGLAIAGFVVAVGALGVAWEQSNDTAAPAQAPAARPATVQDYMKYDYYHGENAQGSQHKETFGTPGPNSRSIEQRLQFQAPPGNARSFEAQQQQEQQPFEAPTSGGRVQLGD